MNLPLISIIIPVKAEVEALKVSLDSLRSSTYPKAFMQIIVVNDGGANDISQVLKQTYPEVEEVVYPEVKGSYYARNRGVEVAKGKWLLFMDTDMQVPPPTISRIVEKCFPNHDYIATDYRLEVKENQPFYEKYFSYQVFNIRTYFKSHHFGGTAFLFVKREVFKAIDGFDERLYSGGDNLFGKQVYYKGYKTYFFDEFIIWHKPKNFSQLNEAFYRTANGIYLLSKLYPNLYTYSPVKNILKWPWSFVKSNLFVFYKKVPPKMNRITFFLAINLRILMRLHLLVTQLTNGSNVKKK